MSFRNDDRGLAGALIGFVAIIVVGGLLFTLIDPALGAVFSKFSTRTTNQQAIDAINLARGVWGQILAFVLFLAVIYLIGNAVLEQKQ